MKIKSVVVVALLLTVAAARGAATNDLAGALRNGLFEEQVDHNLEAAIATYQSVVTKFDTDRQLAATAAFRLGECYRAEGKTNEAMAQYQRVVTDFSDQATLVKLSTQNLAELGGGQSVMPPSVTTNNFNERLQAILDRGKSQQTQDKLAELRTAYAEKNAMLGRLKEMELVRLRQELPTITSDPLLIKYLEQLSDAEQALVKIKVDTAPDNPAYQSAAGVVQDDEHRVNQRIIGILGSMDTELAGIKAQMDQLEKNAMAMSPEEQVLQIQAQRAAMTVQYTNFVVQPTTDEEAQEIVRIQAMIQNSPDLINAAQGAESTPLMKAAVKDELQVAKYLLDHGADVNRESFLMIDNRPTVGTPLHAAAENGHKKMVELLLGAGADVNARTKSITSTPLICAANRSYPAVAEVLLAHGADPNLKDNSLGSPLHYAVHNSSTNLVALLLAHGAGINATNDSGQTPLHLAAGDRAGRVDLVTLLLDNQADVNARMPNGATALHFAAGRHWSEIVKLFLARGAEINARDVEGETALLYAARDGAKASADVLLAAGADPNLGGDTAGDHQGWVPLHYAASGNNIEIAEALLKHGANPNAVTRKFFGQGNSWYEGTTPMILAINNKRADMVGLLLRYKADPNLPNGEGIPPLQRVIELATGQTNIVDVLLRAGADVNKPYDGGFTPLQWAVYKGDTGTVEMILAHKPEVNAIGTGGLTALDLNRRQGWVDRKIPDTIAALLRAHGALDNVPKYDVIQVSRPSQKFAATVFHKGTNDWNHYTLLELLAAHYGFISTTTTNGSTSNRPYSFPDMLNMEAGAIYLDKNSWVKEGALTFPNLEGIKIWRTPEIGTKAREIDVNLAEMIKTGDCTKDMELEWGDVVEIPEMDHPIDVKWSGFSDEARMMFTNCLKRGVQLTVKGQTTNLVLIPQAAVRNYFNGVPGGIMRVAPSFFIGPVLNNSGLLRTSSDLTRVKVQRADVKTGKKMVWTVDCSQGQAQPDLWLRDGDVVEVPEK